MKARFDLEIIVKIVISEKRLKYESFFCFFFFLQDMLNRRISMNMLLKIAKEQVHRQFIMLTPQDMSYVSGSDRVRIFKLNDPERGQQTIPFEAE